MVLLIRRVGHMSEWSSGPARLEQKSRPKHLLRSVHSGLMTAFT